MISIIIPTLNEEEHLKSTVLNLREAAAFPDQIEIIVVDAGSTDHTLESVEGMGIRALSKPEFIFKKHASLNFGADKSKGGTLLFLDADTHLPTHFDLQIKHSLISGDIVGGAFEFSFDQPDWKLQLITLINRVRYRFGKVFYGDQAVFVKREVFQKIRGVPIKPLMETAYMCKKLRKTGKLAILKPGIITSARRFVDHGFFKVAWFDLNMFIRFNLGLSVSGYAEKYWSKNLK